MFELSRSEFQHFVEGSTATGGKLACEGVTEIGIVEMQNWMKVGLYGRVDWCRDVVGIEH